MKCIQCHEVEAEKDHVFCPGCSDKLLMVAREVLSEEAELNKKYLELGKLHFKHRDKMSAKKIGPDAITILALCAEIEESEAGR